VRDIALLVYPGYSVMALAIVAGFEVANSMVDPEPYDLHYVSEKGGPIKTSAGLMLETEMFTDKPFDTLVVGAVCTGAFVLAEAGLLDGRRATTHWMYARELQRDYPKVQMDEDRIFINDGPIWTSAGMTAGVDLGLALIENDLGPELTKAVARKLVVYHRRSGGQSQFSTLLELTPKSDRIQAALAYARDNLHKRLTVVDLAEAAHLSPRQFSRAFHAETGQSPAKAIEHLRVEGARNLLEQSRYPIEVVARQAGFSDRDHMRRAFLRAFGQPPQVLRRTARLESIDIHDEADNHASAV
jgi:transcriptional regulator GlxA family with amidase domain